MILQSSADWVLANAKARLGDAYVYGGVYSPSDLTEGADCSGVVGWVLEALTKGPANMSWAHNVSTESWYYDYNTNSPAAPGTVGPYGTIAVASLADVPVDAALIIDIMHGGGGEDSHTNCSLEGTLIESNGDHGSCTNGTGAYETTASLWTDHYYLPGPIVNDTNLTPLFYPDVSNVQWSSNDQLTAFLASAKASGMAGIMHKVTQGAGFQDVFWPVFRQWCENNNTSWLGYHYVDTSDPAAQARNFVNNNGGQWAMLDFEQGAGNMSNFWNIVNAFNNAGVSVSMAYIPHWYWQQIGQPDLAYLTANQISLVASNYPAGNGAPDEIYSAAGAATGPGWVPYGGCRPTVWQFTDQASIGGINVDCNTYLGPGPNLDDLFTGNIF
jgi:GH25 family lysozyme M1 (1,4-beta-N-acetylmuramidase)